MGSRRLQPGRQPDDLVHFAGRDLFASAVDDFFQSAGDKKIAISIQVALVSRPQPAIGEGLLIGSRIIFVALHDIRTTDSDLARVVVR